jgi:hypothetical protein
MAETTTDETTNTVAEKTTAMPLPGGGTGILMPSGEVVNPIHCSVKNLARLGPAEFDAVLSWVAAERERAERERAKRLAGLEEATAKFRADAEARQAQLERIKQEEPWRLA